jgi:hypothetical protein
MPARFYQLALILLFFSASCTPVRTVYDSQGNEVKDDEPGGEKDLVSTFEKRFDASFSEQKTQDGVPQTMSSKVSSFQRQLDDARKIDKPFATGNFDTGRKLDLRSDGFAGAGKRFNSGKDGIERTSNSMYSTDLRPDFMNESHGISHTNRYRGANEDSRSSLEGMALDTRSTLHHLNESIPYSTNQGSNYVEDRRNNRKQPTIIDYQDYYRMHRNSVRQLLGRDNENP